MFSKYNDEEHVLHLKNYNIEIMIYDKAEWRYRRTFSVTSF